MNKPIAGEGGDEILNEIVFHRFHLLSAYFFCGLLAIYIQYLGGICATNYHCLITHISMLDNSRINACYLKYQSLIAQVLKFDDSCINTCYLMY